MDPAASALSGVKVHDLSGLEAIVRENRGRRAAEIPRVEALIERELRKLAEWARSETLRPLAAEIRSRAEQIRLAEVDRARAEDAAADPRTLRRLSRRLVERLLSIPLATVRDGDIPLDAGHGCYLKRLLAPEDRRDRHEP